LICPLKLFQLRPMVGFEERLAKHLRSKGQAGGQLENLLPLKVLLNSDQIRLGDLLDFIR